MICPTCHTRLKKGCPSCGRLLHLRWNICPFCGAVQTTTKAPPAVAPQPVVRPIEAPADGAMLSVTAPSSLSEPAVDAEVEPVASEETQIKPMPSVEPEPVPEVEEGVVFEPEPPEPETEYSAEPEPEPLEPSEDSVEPEAEPTEEPLPFEFD